MVLRRLNKMERILTDLGYVVWRSDAILVYLRYPKVADLVILYLEVSL